MKSSNLKQVEQFAKSKGYEEVIANVNQKKPMIIQGVKGHFIPEVLCYSKGRLKALITIVESVVDEDELHKFTLFMDYCEKNHLHLHAIYDEQRLSSDRIVEKLTDLGVAIYEDLDFIAMNL